LAATRQARMSVILRALGAELRFTVSWALTDPSVARNNGPSRDPAAAIRNIDRRDSRIFSRWFLIVFFKPQCQLNLTPSFVCGVILWGDCGLTRADKLSAATRMTSARIDQPLCVVPASNEARSLHKMNRGMFAPSGTEEPGVGSKNRTVAFQSQRQIDAIPRG
jgi:hypothetical protein